MSMVRILPEIISNQIAAGEVVERPVSIVKELVENSIDAGATRITIEIKRGGRDLVRVSDNGCGMGKDDALLAIERYATSKISSRDDLFSIKSFGFRGEALPSIASVSKFTLVTREKGADAGTKIFINGGKIIDVSDAGAPFGTEIEVKNLFFNTPVRRKFLKSVNTEMGHIADTVSGMALGNSKTGFRLFHNSRLIKSFQPCDDMLKRLGEVFGSETVKNFCRVSVKARELTIHGYVSDPSFTRSTSRNIRLFVNNRMISDNGLVSAIFRGFKGRIMKGRFPMAVLFITLPFDQVDVNVHPAKLQVRFADQNQLYSTVVKAVHQALCEDEKMGILSDHRKVEEKEKHEKGKIAESFLKWSNTESFTGQVSDQISKKNIIPENRDIFEFDSRLPEYEPEQKQKLETKPEPEQKQKLETKPEPVKRHKQETRSGQELKPFPSCFHVIGQVFGTYIAAESGNDIFLIDQHAAHERIVYEKLKKRAESFKPPSQNLIVSETLELGFIEADLLEKIMDDLSSLGIVMEPFGGTSFIVKSVPSIIDHREITPFIKEMLDKILESGTDTGDDIHKEEWLDDALILMACHSAIRANYTLDIREMEKLISDLEKCENPFNCPHGRPTRIKWSKTEIEKLFKRIV